MGESKDGNRLSSVTPSDGKRGNEHNHKTNKLVSLLKHKERKLLFLREAGDIQKPAGHRFEQSAEAGPAFSRGHWSPEVPSHLSFSVPGAPPPPIAFLLNK